MWCVCFVIYVKQIIVEPCTCVLCVFYCLDCADLAAGVGEACEMDAGCESDGGVCKARGIRFIDHFAVYCYLPAHTKASSQLLLVIYTHIKQNK